MIGLGIAALAATQAVQPAQCELHIWPTQAFYAVFHGATIGPGGPVANMYINSTEDIRDRIKAILPEPEQVHQIQTIDLSSSPKFAAYRVIFHPAPEKSQFANWLDKKIGDGPRVTDSVSPCYAELHLVAVTLYRTTLYSQLQVIYVFRDFGSAKIAARVTRNGGRSNPNGFHGRRDDTPEARALLTDAFRLAAEKILNNKSVLKPL
jgi:hypothetical protein